MESRQGTREAEVETIEARHADYVAGFLARWNEDHPLLAGVLGLQAGARRGTVSDPGLITYLTSKAGRHGRDGS